MFVKFIFTNMYVNYLYFDIENNMSNGVDLIYNVLKK